jgi:hypothetical protein
MANKAVIQTWYIHNTEIRLHLQNEKKAKKKKVMVPESRKAWLIPPEKRKAHVVVISSMLVSVSTKILCRADKRYIHQNANQQKESVG